MHYPTGSAAGLFRRRGAVHGLMHFLETTHLNLAHALARDAEILGQLRKRDPFLGEPARLEDASLALVENGERIEQRLAAVIELLVFRQPRFLVRALVDQPVLPLA